MFKVVVADIFGNPLAAPFSQHRLGRHAGGLLKARRNEGKPRVGILLPEPFATDIGHVGKPRLGLVALLEHRAQPGIGLLQPALVQHQLADIDAETDDPAFIGAVAEKLEP